MTYQTDAKLPGPKSEPSARYRRHLKKVAEANDLAARIELGLVRENRRTYRSRPATLRGSAAIRSPDGLAIERDLHIRFGACREHGEWFRPEPDLLAYIAEWTLERMDMEQSAEHREALNKALGGRPYTVSR